MTTIHRISIGVVLAFALGISAAPASARQFNLNANGSNVPASSQAANQATTPSYAASTPPTIVRVSAHNGFDWGDAGIGAAGGLALAMVGLGGALAMSQRRTRRARHSTAATS